MPTVADYSYFKFQPNDDSSGLGYCNGCGEDGIVGKLCLNCCGENGMVVGVSDYCSLRGPGFDRCLDCNKGGYLPRVKPIVLGYCEACGARGQGFTKCFHCRGGDYLPPVYGVCDICEKLGPPDERCYVCDRGFCESIKDEAEEKVHNEEAATH
jgi:hypothetical protein